MADLEVLLFLRRRPDAEWDPNAVADLLRINRELSASIFRHLEVGGFLTSRSEPLLLYRYAPQPDVAATLDRLAGLYGDHRMMIIALLAGRRSPAGLRAFADAFRLTRKQ